MLRDAIYCVQQALLDFKERICKYEEVYETITDRNMHYIKLIDMCAELHKKCICLDELSVIAHLM